MGETASDRVGVAAQLATLDPHPESVPINNLVQVEGTPLAGTATLDPHRVRAHHRARARPHAARAWCGCPRAAQEMSEEHAGAVLLRRRQLDLLRREAADHRQSRSRDATTPCSSGSASVPSPLPAGTEGRGRPARVGAVLADLDERGLRRRRRNVRRLAHDTAEIELDGQRCIDFCSNDYLGLSAHPRVTGGFHRSRARARCRRARLAPGQRPPGRARGARGGARGLHRA